MLRDDPVQEFYSIGDVCTLTDLKPHVLRYWESQFKLLNPAKNRSGNRVYARREVELILLVKHLLYSEKYTIDGARQKLEHLRRLLRVLHDERLGDFQADRTLRHDRARQDVADLVDQVLAQ